MDDISKEVFDALVARVSAVETKFEAVLAKLDLDAGVTDANYAALQGIATNNPKTVTNVTPAIPGKPKGFMVKFKDLSGAEHTLAPGAVLVVSGVSASMNAYVAKSYITVV